MREKWGRKVMGSRKRGRERREKRDSKRKRWEKKRGRECFEIRRKLSRREKDETI